MTTSPFRFELLHVDRQTGARRGRFHTPRGVVEMPAFMPVGTLGTVKGVTVEQLRATGAQMVLANTYHLALRPGADVVADLGGLHCFSGFSGPMLTDSGGFQIFSLAQRTKITEQGATFRSHIDGSPLELTPERAIEIQQQLGSDVAMVLDHVVALPNDRQVVQDAMERTIRWAARCRAIADRADQAVFGIVQGGLDRRLRTRCAEKLAALDFPGYAIGGLSVGESPAEMYEMIEATTPELPPDRPRYLMGVGRPADLLQAVARGVDLFDCVMPTRNGRNALAFTDRGPLRMRNRKYQRDTTPLDVDCPSPASRHSRGYLRHLFMAGEMLGPILLTLHNLTYYQRLLAAARAAIEEDRYAEFVAGKLAGWSADCGDFDGA